jgi:hypothetical protein
MLAVEKLRREFHPKRQIRTFAREWANYLYLALAALLGAASESFVRPVIGNSSWITIEYIIVILATAALFLLRRTKWIFGYAKISLRTAAWFLAAFGVIYLSDSSDLARFVPQQVSLVNKTVLVILLFLE